MEDFIELGIEGVDKVVDKHFHRVPDAVLHPATYHPRQAKKLDLRNLSRRHRNRSRRRGSTSSTPSSSSSDTQEERFTKQRSASTTRGNLGNMDVDDMYTYTPETSVPGDPYSHEPPRTRPQYQPPLENPYTERTYYSQSPPPIAAYVRDGRIAKSEKENARRFEEDYYSDTLPSQSRQKAVTRRSHSMSNHRPQDSYSSERRLKGRRGRRDYSDESESESDDWGRGGGGGGNGGGGCGGGGGGGGGGRKGGKGEGGIEEKLGEVFTGSNIGLGAGVAGAVIGGWAAQKAQVATGADKMNSSKRREKGNTLLTVLGATAAGLAANAFVDRWEENKRRIRQNDEEWEQKFGSGASGREEKRIGTHDRSSRSSRSDRGDRDRDRERDRERERYRSDYGSSSGRSGGSYRNDSEYLGERHGKGYKAYDDDFE